MSCTSLLTHRGGKESWCWCGALSGTAGLNLPGCSCSSMHWGLRSCSSMHWSLRSCSSMHWGLRGCTHIPALPAGDCATTAQIAIVLSFPLQSPTNTQVDSASFFLFAISVFKMDPGSWYVWINFINLYCLRLTKYSVGLKITGQSHDENISF